MRIKYFFLVTAAGFVMSCNADSENVDYSSQPSTDTSSYKMENNVASTESNNMLDTISAGKMMKDTVALQSTTDKKIKKAKVMIQMPVAKYSERKIEMDKQGYYNTAEVLPSYPGGEKALVEFFNNNLEYPQQATDNGTEGQVTISFLVDESGKISSPEVVSKKVGDGVEEEALRVFNKMPSWTPGQVKGKNVKTRFTLPVRFQVSQ